jgi:salicylate hydroxylase
MPANWQKYALMRLDAAGAWSTGSLALLGDAAHAMLPFLAQGAVMAIEDAAVLARTLAGATDVPAALKSYEAQRKGRVGKVAAAAARTGDRYHLAGAMATARDLALRVAGERLILNELDWIYRWRPSGE